MSFIGAIQKRITALVPWYLRQRHVSTFLEAVALTLDGAIDGGVAAFRLAHPLNCHPSALPTISRDRRLRIYATEPETSQRYRLSRFWQLRRQFGTHAGQMNNLQPFFLDRPALPMLRAVHQSGDGATATWHTLNTDGTYEVHHQTPSNWEWDAHPEQWSRFWVILYVDALALDPPVGWDGGGEWDGGTLRWDELFSDERNADMQAAILEAKACHSALWGLILATDPASFDPTATAVTDPAGWTTLPVGGNWNFPIDNVTGDPTRLPSASFVFDAGPT